MTTLSAAPALHVSEPLVAPLARRVPSFQIEFANRFALRGLTPKGGYETRYNQQQDEVRLTFLARGENPLENIELLARTPATDFDPVRFVNAIARNEEELPWVQKSVDPTNGRRTVTVLPFGGDASAPRVLVTTSASSGFIALHVENARDMSPAEALLVAGAIAKAASLAAE
jgi:hypothetical protein